MWSPGGTHMLRHMGMCHPNVLVFYQKSLDMGPIFNKKSIKEGPIFIKIVEKIKISHFWGEKKN